VSQSFPNISKREQAAPKTGESNKKKSRPRNNEWQETKNNNQGAETSVRTGPMRLKVNTTSAILSGSPVRGTTGGTHRKTEDE